MKLTFLVFLFAVFFPYLRRPKSPIDSYIHRLHKYSGLSPEHFYMFLDEMRIVKQNLYTNPRAAADALYAGVNHMQELALYNQRADEPYAHEIQDILTSLIADVEDTIQYTAMLLGLRFNPRFINDVIPNVPDGSEDFGLKHKPTASVCTRGACR